MRILDDRGESGMVREEFTVAKRPVIAAACARPGGANDGALQYDQHHETQHDGRKQRQSRAAARLLRMSTVWALRGASFVRKNGTVHGSIVCASA